MTRTILAENATDQDRRDTLTSFFEMHTIPTFDAPAVRMTAGVAFSGGRAGGSRGGAKALAVGVGLVQRGR